MGSEIDVACFDSNGIVSTPDKKALLVVQTNTGRLFRIDTTGHATLVDLGSDHIMWGDGMALEGRVLHVVQNPANTDSVIELDAVPATAQSKLISVSR